MSIIVWDNSPRGSVITCPHLERAHTAETYSDRILGETRTLVVNAHGAVMLLRLNVSMEQLLTLRNSKTGEEVSCRVVYVSPRPLDKDRREVGVEFTNPFPRFWGIAFPPSNWTTRSPEAKGR